MRLLLLLLPICLFARTEVKTLDDGCELSYTYNERDLLESLTSSDGSIHHSFTYDPEGRLISAEDHNLNIFVRRHLSATGKLLRETFNRRYLIQKGYNDEGKIQCLWIHNTAKILFKYKHNHLKKIIRIASTGKKLYAHNFDAYDGEGHLLLETMIFNLGRIAYEWTQNQQIRSISSPFFTQSCMYNKRGELVNTKVDGKATHYVYASTTDPYLESSKQHLILYPDSEELPKDCTYTYDRLGRLTEINSDTIRISYSYDPLGRKLRKKVYRCDPLLTHKISEEFYLYDNYKHIATLDKEGNLKALRILAPDQKKAVAVEVDGKIYAPISDAQGNIRTLIDQHKLIAATYDYSYFGKHIFLDNPTPIPFVLD